MKKLMLSILIIVIAMGTVTAQEPPVWTEQNSGVTHTLWTVFFLDSLYGWSAGDNGKIVRTTDGGDNWQALELGYTDSLHAIVFTDPEKGWAAGNQGVLYVTSDSGTTWLSMDSLTVDFITDGWFVNNSLGFFVGQEGFDGVVLRTSDGGVSWTKTTVPNSSAMSSIVMLSESLGWVAGRDDISRTIDGGVTWQSAVTPDDPSYKSYVGTIWFTDSLTGFGSGRYGGISRSEDGGQTWIFYDSSLGEWTEDIQFADSNRGVMVGERGILRWTEDRGIIWNTSYPRHPSSLEAPWFRSVYFIDPHNAWVVGDSGIILQGGFPRPPVSVERELEPHTGSRNVFITPTGTLDLSRAARYMNIIYVTVMDPMGKIQTGTFYPDEFRFVPRQKLDPGLYLVKIKMDNSALVLRVLKLP